MSSGQRIAAQPKSYEVVADRWRLRPARGLCAVRDDLLRHRLRGLHGCARWNDIRSLVIIPCDRCGLYEAAEDDKWCDHCIYEVEELAEEVEPLGDSRLMRHYYTVEDLERRVEEYEAEYNLPSEKLLGMWEKEIKPAELPHFERHVWLSLFRELKEIRGSG